MISDQSQLFYRFDDYLLKPAERHLLRGGRPVPLAPKVFDTLRLLVENHGRLIGKSEFLQRIWPETSVEEVALAHCISHLRKVMRDGTGERRLIETVPKCGYRFIAAVEVCRKDSEDVSSPVRIAVLPFENLGGGPKRDYLASGFTEETIAALGQIDPDRLSVVGRTTMMTYRSTTKTLSEISRELNAEYLIESSIRLERGHLRIMSRLVRGRDQVQVWSASYENELKDMLAFQRELGTAIAGQIRLQLSPERLIAALARRQTQNAEAFDQYLRGRYLWNQLSPATTKRAMEHYAQSTKLDPGYALAWSGLADAFAASPINGDALPLEAWPRAREAADRAVGAEPDLAESQTSLAMVGFFLDWDWVTAERTFRRAIALDPSYCLAHRTLGILLSHSGRHEEAKSAVRRARNLEPFYPAHHALSAQVAFNAKEFDSAVQFAKQAIDLAPHFWIGHLQLAQALQQLGSNDLALNALQAAARISGGNTKVAGLHGYILGRLGRADEALRIVKGLEDLRCERYVPPYVVALMYAGLGRTDAMFEWLDRVYEARDVHAVFLPVDPKWDDFRDDSRFVALLRRCNFHQTFA